MSGHKEFSCIECPRGCRLLVDIGDDGTPSITGNACPKGATWGAREAVSPMRTLTTTVAVKGSDRRRLPVRTNGELPLGRLLDAMAAIDPVVVRPPLHNGDIILPNLLGLGVDVIATDDLPVDA
jgi:CxxC motif-containing protein